MNHVTNIPTFTKSNFSGPTNLKSWQGSVRKPPSPRFGSNTLIRSNTLLSFNFAAWKKHLPFIAMASSMGIIILNKITGGFKNFPWHWPQNPFTASRKKIDDLEQQATPLQANTEAVTEDAIEQVQPPEPLVQQKDSIDSDATIKASQNTLQAREPEQAQHAIDTPKPIVALTQARLLSLLEDSPTVYEDIPLNSPSLSPQSTATEHSFEIINPNEDWEHGVISLPNSPLNLDSPVPSRSMSPIPKHLIPNQADPVAKL